MESGEPERLLRQSEQLLRQRDYSGCRKYALLAQKSDPHLASVTDEILAVADVLLAAQTRIGNRKNYYSFLQLNFLSLDLELIKNNFKRLSLLLNPIENEFSLAEEAFNLVREAWCVLSDPNKKAEYDEEVEKYYREEVLCGGGNGSFWTACPYCYYVYEYLRVYVDCCLRCQNCRRGFHGVEIPAPPAVVPGTDDQYYCCFGFFPLGFSGNVESEVGGKNGALGGCVDDDGFVEISDDESELECVMGFKGNPMNVNSRKLQEEVKVGDNSSDGGGFVMQGSEKTEELNVVKERPILRRKTVARNTKKIMGRGIRGRRVDLNVEAGKDDEETERGSGEGGFVIGGVEYFEGEDDLLVGLPIFGDGGNGKFKASS